MTTANIINIVLGVLLVVLYVVGYYFSTKTKLMKAAAGAINNAEQDDKTGEEKMAIAIEQIYALVPVALRPFFTKHVVEGLVQAAFDKIDDFAEKQVKKAAENATNKTTKAA